MQAFCLFVCLLIKIFSKFAKYFFVVHLWSCLVQFKMTIAPFKNYILFIFYFFFMSDYFIINL